MTDKQSIKLEELKLLALITRRTERLVEEYTKCAPNIIKATEINLIIDASKKLLAL